MTTEKRVIEELSCKNIEGILELLPKENRVLVVKFTANWCGPCQRIKDGCYAMFNQLADNVVVADLNIDFGKNIDVYRMLKRKRQINGIPTLMAWYPDPQRAFWYVPDDSVVGGDINEIREFLKRVNQKAISI